MAIGDIWRQRSTAADVLSHKRVLHCWVTRTLKMNTVLVGFDDLFKRRRLAIWQPSAEGIHLVWLRRIADRTGPTRRAVGALNSRNESIPMTQHNRLWLGRILRLCWRLGRRHCEHHEV